MDVCMIAVSFGEDRWDEKASLRAGVPLGPQFKSGLEAQAGG